MKKMLYHIWQILGSIHFAIGTCLLIVADLTWGYFSLNHNGLIFDPLNHVGLMNWISTYGLQNIRYTAWLFILLFLLTLFCVNTFVCTTDRVNRLLRSRQNISWRHLLFMLSPHIMHYAVIVILSGYLFSYLFSHVISHATLVPGASTRISDTPLNIAFLSWNPFYYKGNRMPYFQKRVLNPRIRIKLTHGADEKISRLSVNRPAWIKGYGIFLKGFKPEKIGGMAKRVRIDLTVRKDPGVRFYMAGIGLFLIGLTIYITEWLYFKKTKKDSQ